MSDWMDKHFHKRQSDLEIRDNYQPIQLVWEEEWFEEDLLVLRENYMELQAEFHISAAVLQADSAKHIDPWGYGK